MLTSFYDYHHQHQHSGHQPLVRIYPLVLLGNFIIKTHVPSLIYCPQKVVIGTVLEVVALSLSLCYCFYLDRGTLAVHLRLSTLPNLIYHLCTSVFLSHITRNVAIRSHFSVLV